MVHRKRRHHTDNRYDASKDAKREVFEESSGNAGGTDGEMDKSSLRSLPTLPDGSLLFIEACCGCALLSSCVSKMGFEVMPIDFEGNKHRPYVHVVQLDLRKRETWQFLRYVAESRRPFHFHAAPPCGTASRARDIPMSSTDHGPPPLRSEEWPLGFPSLSGFWANKVSSANQIYLQLAAFCMFLNMLHITWSIENPTNSYLWSIRDYKKLREGAMFVIFDSCIHGGSRKKSTGLLTTLEALIALEGECQGDHDHLEWGHVRNHDGTIVFDTSKEAAYPKLLCERFATLLSMQASILELAVNPVMQSLAEDSRVATYKQPRGRKIPPLISEFVDTKIVRCRNGDEPKLDDKSKLTSDFYGIPSGSKMLRKAPVDKGNTKLPKTMWVFGIFRDPLAFLNIAKEVQHPFDSFRAVPHEILKVVCNILSKHPLQTMKKRLEKLQHWRRCAKELADDNKKRFDNMDSGCATVLKNKHLSLLQKISDDLGWKDVDVHKEIQEGFKLVGLQKPTGIFGADVKPRSFSEDELIKHSRHLKPALWSKIRNAPKSEFEDELWTLTMEEVTTKRWLDGPYSYDELECLFEGVWNPVRRFGVWQRNKLRAIDDFSESGVNASFAYLEKIQLRALDEIIWVAACFVKYVIHHEHFSFDIDGEKMSGKVHSWWKSLDTNKSFLQVKTVDLKSAYKQFAIHPSDRRLSVLALRKPDTGEVAGFVSRTLPFGSTASVLHFNRAARLLHRIGLDLDVAWTNYYDDYPVVDFSFLASNTNHTIKALTSLLGFECSTDKELPFADEAEMLGVVLDVSKSGSGILSVKNKPSRTEELASNLKALIEAGRVDPSKLPSLFGRALFLECQISGRLGKLALSELRDLERCKKCSVDFSAVQIKALHILLKRYQESIPRTLKLEDQKPPVLLFTDGACEEVSGELVATVGGVLFHHDVSLPRVYGCEVNRAVLKSWMDADKVQPVSLTELYAVCLARSLWKSLLDNQKVIVFIDNQGVLDACIKGWSGEEQMKSLLLHFETVDGVNPFLPWFARVPSSSNCADYPSRGLWSKLKQLIGEFVLDEAQCFVDSSRLKTLEESAAIAEEHGG